MLQWLIIWNDSCFITSNWVVTLQIPFITEELLQCASPWKPLVGMLWMQSTGRGKGKRVERLLVQFQQRDKLNIWFSPEWRPKCCCCHTQRTNPNVRKQRWCWGFPGLTRSYTNTHTNTHAGRIYTHTNANSNTYTDMINYRHKTWYGHM